MADNKRLISTTAGVPTEDIGSEVNKFKTMCEDMRRAHERRWYDNNFFDDGFHFRYVSRTTGHIVDESERTNSYAPTRAIPKASRQVRGIANLLLGIDPTPVVYPERVSKSNFTRKSADGQEVVLPAYEDALKIARDKAHRIGAWIEDEWKDQELKEKLIHAVILACKHSVSYLQVWADITKEKINTKVFDAFDIYVLGDLTELYDNPMIVKAAPMLISKIKANKYFDEEQKKLINPDNRTASSEIKQAYLNARYGKGVPVDSATTLILKEAYIKEYLDSSNAVRVASDLGEDAKGLREGDVVIRQVFEAGGVWLYDKYTNLKEYPFVDIRLEPGPLYSVPLIERFIPANKSLDIVTSRIERYANTMGIGVIMKRKGENFRINNSSAAQVIEYETTKPEQLALSPLQQTLFQFVNLLEKTIEEQGASTSTLGQLPEGVRSGVAIESIKATEYANLKIPTDMLKKAVRRITEHMIQIAANYYIKPREIRLLESGEPTYFDVIGQRGEEAYKKIKEDLPRDIVVIKDDIPVDIQIESGLGFTEAGKKETMQGIIAFMTQMAQQGLLTTDAVKVVIQRFLEVYSFGATQEFMEGLKSGMQTAPLTDDQMKQMKIAVLEVLRDAGVVGQEQENKLVNSTKVGVVEALRDTGMIDKQTQSQEKAPSRSISFKDLPPEGKVQMAAQAGIEISPNDIAMEEVKSQVRSMIQQAPTRGVDNAIS